MQSNPSRSSGFATYDLLFSFVLALSFAGMALQQASYLASTCSQPSQQGAVLMHLADGMVRQSGACPCQKNAACAISHCLDGGKFSKQAQKFSATPASYGFGSISIRLSPPPPAKNQICVSRAFSGSGNYTRFWVCGS